MSEVITPRNESGGVNWNQGWEIWGDTVRYYPSAVHRRRLIRNWIVPLRPKTLLDVGCGPGNLLFTLKQELLETQFTGVDNAHDTVAKNRQRFPWARFASLDLATAHLSETFDVVVCSEVIEHIHDDERALDNLVAMTKRYLLITVPTGPLYPLEAGFGHVRHYEQKSLCQALERRGLRILRSMAWGFPFMNLFKYAANLQPQAVMNGFGAGRWSFAKRLLGKTLTGFFYLNLSSLGPQIVLLAEQPQK